MRIVTLMLMCGVALSGASLAAHADSTAGIPLDTLNLDDIAKAAKPTIPPETSALVISRTPQPEIPGLPMSPREKAAFGDTAHTVRILPSADGTGGASVSWSGYARAGVIYSHSSSNSK